MDATMIELINSNTGLYICGFFHGFIMSIMAVTLYAGYEFVCSCIEKRKQLKEERKERESELKEK